MTDESDLPDVEIMAMFDEAVPVKVERSWVHYEVSSPLMYVPPQTATCGYIIRSTLSNSSQPWASA